MTRISIGFSKPINRNVPPLFSYGIRLVEGTPYSHTYVKIKTRSGEQLIFEAAGGVLRLINYKYWKKYNKTVEEYDLQIDDIKYSKIFKHISKDIGMPYGFLQLFGILLSKIFKFKTNKLSSGKSYQVCSESVYYFLKSLYNIDSGKDPDLVSPKHINELISYSMRKREGIFVRKK